MFVVTKELVYSMPEDKSQRKGIYYNGMKFTSEVVGVYENLTKAINAVQLEKENKADVNGGMYDTTIHNSYAKIDSQGRAIIIFEVKYTKYGNSYCKKNITVTDCSECKTEEMPF